MKKILVVLSLVAAFSVEASAFAAGCGNNAARNANTRASSANGTTAAPQGPGVGTKRN